MAEAPNVDQTRAWNGADGEHWSEHAGQYERTTRRHRRYLAAQFRAGDDVLDVGCGNGALSRDAATAGARSVLGVDLSAAMLARAAELAGNNADVQFVQADAQSYPFEPHAFDLAVSSFGVMFFDDPVVAFTNIRRAQRNDGRLAMLVWREIQRNEWISAVRLALAVGRELPSPPPGSPGPTSLADPDRLRAILTEAGYRDINADEVYEPVDFGATADDAFAFFRDQPVARGLTADLDPDKRAEAFDNLHATFAAHQTTDGVLLDSSAWLVTARA